MEYIKSTQVDVEFLFCGSPVTIDKSADWGPGNVQEGPNGAFLKTSEPGVISHLVQPNADRSAPEGWVPGSGPGLFSKAPIWIDTSRVLQPGETIKLDTLDGEMDYKVTAQSMLCYNGDANGHNPKDVWVQKVTDLQKNYKLDESN